MSRLWVGLALAAAGWLCARAVAGAFHLRRPWAWLFDAALVGALFAGVLGITARPLFAGVVVFALIGGFAFADWGKRQVLREPVVFTDLSELIELVRHPHLYLPYVGTARVLAGAGLALAAFVALLALEPPILPDSLLRSLAAAATVAAILIVPATLALSPAAWLLRRFRVTGDPARDAAELGPIGLLFIYGVVTRAARPEVRAAIAAPAPLRLSGKRPPDIVLVQCESFFDGRRLHPSVPAGLLPRFDALKAEATQWGLMTAPTWGASTIRTEFAALTGLAPEQMGFDRFNPYQGLARRPMSSLASRLKAVGYRTVCIHPHDRRFYGRDAVMPALGFDAFYGEEAFAGAARTGRYVSDLEAARFAARIVEQSDQPAFVFVITMGGHGPWDDVGAETGRLPALGSEEVERYLASLSLSDAMIEPLVAALEPRGGALGFYGDHLPSLDLDRFELPPLATDYVLWRAGAPGPSLRRDLHAHELGEALLAAAGLAP